MPTLEIAPALTLNYLDENPAGNQTVLLLHGLGATSESWAAQIPTLAAGYRVLAPDARGFGQSTYPGKTSVAALAADMVALLDGLGIVRAHVVGISMGGVLALQMALDHPQCVEKLVLVSTFASLRPDRLSGWLYFALRFVLVHTLGLPAQARAVAQRVFPHPDQAPLRQVFMEQVLQADPRAYRAAMRALARFNVRSRLSEVRASTLIITGEADTTAPPRNQQPLVENIPGARQKRIAGAGHAVMAEQPGVFNSVLLEFLDSSVSRTLTQTVA